MATSSPDEVTAFLIRVKELIDRGQRSLAGRQKNLETLAWMGLTIQQAWHEIGTLTYNEYVSGPDPDHDSTKRMEWWKFGKSINGVRVYIKIRISEKSRVVCLSFHVAQYPIKFPY